jgi:hypothetical protein
MSFEPDEIESISISGATGEPVNESGKFTKRKFLEMTADDLKELPKGKVRVIDENLLDFNKGGKRRKTRRNKRKSKKRKSRRRISRKR